MTSDEELEKLAQDWIEVAPRDDWEILADIESFKAGFRACEKMMAERWPSDDEVRHNAVHNQEFNDNFLGGVRWLKQKLLGDESQS